MRSLFWLENEYRHIGITEETFVGFILTFLGLLFLGLERILRLWKCTSTNCMRMMTVRNNDIYSSYVSALFTFKLAAVGLVGLLVLLELNQLVFDALLQLGAETDKLFAFGEAEIA
jgi:hypothetical protein